MGGLKQFLAIVARGTKSENDDILKATHAAYVSSMEVMAAAACRSALSDEERDAATQFHDLVRSKSFREFRASGEHFPLDAANAAIDRLFSHGLAHATGSTDHVVCDPFAEIALADLVSWQLSVPGLFRQLFLDGQRDCAPWNTVFRDNFSKILKTKTPEFRILTVERLGELRRMVIELGVGANARFDHLDQAVSEIKSLLAERGQRLLKARGEAKRAAKPAGSVRLPKGLISLLDELSVQPSDFTISDQHPPAINRAIQLYMQNWAEFAPATRTHDVIMRVSDYPSLYFARLEAAHFEFRQLLMDLQKRLPDLGTMLSRHTQYVGAFLEDINLPVRRKVLIASSFYYHSTSRRHAWGVIPLGFHRAFGVVLDQDLLRHIVGGNPAELSEGEAASDSASEQLGALAARLPPGTLFGANLSPRQAANLIRKIVRHVAANNGTILYRRGYVQHDMLLDLVSQFNEPDLTGNLQDVLEAETADDESQFAVFRQTNDAQRAVVAAFDLGQIDRVCAGIRQASIDHEGGYAIVIIRRERCDTVGLGFSLPLLPLLLRQGEWAGAAPAELLYRWLARAAVEIYLNRPAADMRDAFLSIGLDLSADWCK